MKNFLYILIFCVIAGFISIGYFFLYQQNATPLQSISLQEVIENYQPENKIEKAAFMQFGVVTEYDMSNGYYAGGNPPAHMGVCSDVVIRALREQGYDLQEKIFTDITNNPTLYSDTPDININHRRVKNMLVFFQRHFQSLPLEVNDSTLHLWKAGDIITYEQIPGRLWHIGIVSGLTDNKGVPLLIDNHGYGTTIRIRITDWNSPISGHFRFIEGL